jgi:hypothetical protein
VVSGSKRNGLTGSEIEDCVVEESALVKIRGQEVSERISPVQVDVHVTSTDHGRQDGFERPAHDHRNGNDPAELQKENHPRVPFGNGQTGVDEREGKQEPDEGYRCDKQGSSGGPGVAPYRDRIAYGAAQRGTDQCRDEDDALAAEQRGVSEVDNGG